VALLQKGPIILRSLPIEATPYPTHIDLDCQKTGASFMGLFCIRDLKFLSILLIIACVTVCCNMLQCVASEWQFCAVLCIFVAAARTCRRCVAVCYGVLQLVARMLQRLAVRCRVLQLHALDACVLQCVAVCCSVLQCVAVCCSVSQRVAVCCKCYAVFGRALQCVAAAPDAGVLQCVAVCCGVLQGWCRV